ncbi:type I glyceraldehyde-3-phosphate dehydrogenase [Pseudonocardia sp. GCM10023141]|uniref:type I glyceraldehyde-3-phosphate dehydrogenase n=1 Tax=Pseudonocardia sp. GCM10023141 TaxID=3252653 RepID=UPI00360E7F08
MGGARIAISGFGRIGRHFLRAAVARGSDLDIVAINDLGRPATMGYLLEYDTVQGRLDADIKVVDDHLQVGERSLRLVSSRHPSMAPWGELGIDVVVDCSGLFTSRELAGGHLVAGARRVIVSAPTTHADVTICVGVNESRFDAERHAVISNASCSTNCVAVTAKVLHDAFGITSGWMTTVHAITNDQELLDSNHHDVRRGRAAGQNIVPATTGAGNDLGLVIPELAGKVQSAAIRVPVPAGSLTDLTVTLDRRVTAEEVNSAFRSAAADGPLRGILGYTDAPIVSSDVLGDPHSCVISARDTIVHGDQVKVYGWYDNEWAYANRLLDLVELVVSRAA